MKEIRALRSLFRLTHTRMVLFIFPVMLSLAASFFEGVSISLLLPISNAIIRTDFQSLLEVRAFAVLAARFEWFSQKTSYLFVFLFILLFLTTVLKQIFQYLASTSFSRQVYAFIHKLRTLIFNRYLDNGKLFFDRHSAGSLQQILMEFTHTVGTCLINTHAALIQLGMLVVYLGMLFYISWQVALLTIVFFPILHGVMGWVIDKIRRTSDDYAMTQNELGKKLFNVLSCLPLIKAYTNEKKEKDEFEKMSDWARLFQFSIEKKMQLILPLQEVVLLVAIMGLVFVMSAIVVKGGGQKAIANFLVYIYILRRLAVGLSALNQTRSILAALSGPILQIQSVLSTPPFYLIEDGKESFLGLKRVMEFKGVSFNYGEDRQILNQVHFRIQGGKMTALLGPSGAGKTTIIQLIMRFYDPSEGGIWVDGKNIRDFTLESFRGKIAMVSQDIHLFNETLHYNLLYGVSDTSEEQLWNAIRKARLEELIHHLPNQMNTLIGDRGVQLSGGERQRVSIARAFLKNAEIILLDEATSALDSQNEHMIQQVMGELIQGKTTVVIAHRLSTIRNADQIIIIENGGIVEQGNYQEVFARKGRFYQYLKDQKEISED